MDKELCIENVERIVKNPYYIGTQVIHIAFSLTAIFFIILTRDYLVGYRCHKNVKVIFWALYGCIIVHGLIFITFETQHMVTAWTAKTPCDLFQSPMFCLPIRIALHLTCNSFVMLQLGLCVERTLATLSMGSYETHGLSKGTSVCIVAIVHASLRPNLAVIQITTDFFMKFLMSCLNFANFNTGFGISPQQYCFRFLWQLLALFTWI
ncbi:hypothetical protein NECAME_12449 [Necator americanus]|uniref:Uncharacterized protein n=1 Tax=Necator americanus TaxID=51031 RepID=W2T017_NECAM|nr:hypothetical protein NECAME_12449 [Necator americanus]ETN75340.1 hypothetical protein NECAME_12449 [Necator americanus]